MWPFTLTISRKLISPESSGCDAKTDPDFCRTPKLPLLPPLSWPTTRPSIGKTPLQWTSPMITGTLVWKLLLSLGKGTEPGVRAFARPARIVLAFSAMGFCSIPHRAFDNGGRAVAASGCLVRLLIGYLTFD